MAGITLEINGRDVEVDRSFLDLPPAEQEATVNEIATSMGITAGGPNGFMRQLNAGIGDVVDFFNPFDKPHALNPFPDGTGSAAEGMNSLGIDAATEPPDGFIQAFGRGTGEALATAPLIATGAKMLSQAPGLVGAVADDAARSLTTTKGVATEALAGGVFEGTAEVAENAGAPDWVQNTAAIAAPLAVAGAIRGAYRAAPYIIVPSAVRRARAELAPFTESGATEVARNRLQSLAGGPDRAEQLAEKIGGTNPLDLTPAQQTADPNMLAVEQLTAFQSPAVREHLSSRQQASQSKAIEDLTPDGNVDDALMFFEARRADFKADMRDRVTRAQADANAALTDIDGNASEAENSIAAMSNIREELRVARQTEQQLWDAVDGDATVSTASARAKAQEWQQELGRAKAGDMPDIARKLLLQEDGYGAEESVREMHNLYSTLREVARNARAGTNQKNTLAKVANDIAEAVLEDLGAQQADTAVGRQINEARAFSAALHETFDQGAVGRLLRRTSSGDTAVDPELALKRTAGRAGTEGAVAARQIEDAGVQPEFIADYLRGQFAERVQLKGSLTAKDGQAFMARNKQLLDRYPQLRDEIESAVQGKLDADQLADRIARRLPALERQQASNVAKFIGGNPEKAVRSVFADARPALAAQRLVNAAKKDPTGAAMKGVQRAFADALISGASTVRDGQQTLLSDSLLAQVNDPKTREALRRVFNDAEMRNFKRIAGELAKAEAAIKSGPSIGSSLSGAKVNRVIEFAAGIIAANHGANLGNRGASLQTAQMASGSMREMLAGLSADRASRLIAEAVVDPELFRTLLMSTDSVKMEERVMNRLVPYLAGSLSAGMVEE